MVPFAILKFTQRNIERNNISRAIRKFMLFLHPDDRIDKKYGIQVPKNTRPKLPLQKAYDAITKSLNKDMTISNFLLTQSFFYSTAGFFFESFLR